MKNWLRKQLMCLSIFGWKYLYVQLFPAYWQQDLYNKNDGYDIVTIRPLKDSYFYGCIQERDVVFERTSV